MTRTVLCEPTSNVHSARPARSVFCTWSHMAGQCRDVRTGKHTGVEPRPPLAESYSRLVPSMSPACFTQHSVPPPLGCRVARLAKASPRQPQPCFWCSVSCAVCPRPPSPESNGWHWQRSCRACPSHNVRACVCQPCPPFVVSYSRLAFKFGGLESNFTFKPKLSCVDSVTYL